MTEATSHTVAHRNWAERSLERPVENGGERLLGAEEDPRAAVRAQACGAQHSCSSHYMKSLFSAIKRDFQGSFNVIHISGIFLPCCIF